MSSLSSYLINSIGVWEGLRIYIEPANQPYVINTTTKVSQVNPKDNTVLSFVENLQASGINVKSDFAFLFEWNSFRDQKQYSSGSILTIVNDDTNTLYRNKGYLTNDITISDASFSSNSQMVLKTNYGGYNFSEEFTFLGAGVRSRHTNQYTTGGVFKRAGRYLETRLANTPL